MANHETNWILRFIDDITKPLQKPTEATKDLSDTVDTVTASLDDMDDTTRAVAKRSLKSYNQLTDKIQKQETEVGNLEKKLRDFGGEMDKVSRKKLELDIKKGKQNLAILKDDLNDVEKELNDIGKESEDAFGKFDEGISGIANADFSSVSAALSTIRGGITGVTKASLSFIATPIGAALLALGAIGLVANEFIDYNQAAREANIITQQITKTTGDALDEVRLRGDAMNKTFGTEFKDNLLIAKNLVEAFDVSYDEAFNTIEDGLIRGGMANDDFMQSLKEYPKLFAKNGFALEDFQRIVNTGIDMGIYDDKLPDAIKEFSISLTDQTKATKEALDDAFGKKFTDTLFQGIMDGSITPKEGIQEIAKETEKVGVNAVEAQRLTANLFRGSGEDAGGFKEIIEAVNTALNEEERALLGLEEHLSIMADKQRELGEAKDEAMSSDSVVAFSESMSVFWKDMKIGWYNFITDVTGVFNQMSKNLVQAMAVIEAYPTVVVQTFKNVLGDLRLLLSNFETAGEVVKNVLSGNIGAAKEGFKALKADISDDLNNLGKDAFINPGKQLAKAYVDAGKDVDAYNDILSFYGLSKEERAKKIGVPGLPGNEVDPEGNGEGTNKGLGAGLGSGPTEGRSGGITMTLEVNNYFNVKDGSDIMSRKDEIIDMVVGAINSRVKDGIIAATV